MNVIAGTTILLVSEDERWGAEVVRETLSGAGDQVVAVDAPEARAAARHYGPALIVANLSGSEHEDIELYRVLRHAQDAPILAIGSPPDPHWVVDAIDAGADGYINRPFNPRELVLRVQRLLGN